MQMAHFIQSMYNSIWPMDGGESSVYRQNNTQVKQQQGQLQPDSDQVGAQMTTQMHVLYKWGTIHKGEKKAFQ